MEQLDLRRAWRDLYTARQKPDLVQVPDRQALTIAHTGEPGTESMTPVFSALYPIAYTLKFAVRAERDVNYPVLPPEGFFRAADIKQSPLNGDGRSPSRCRRSSPLPTSGAPWRRRASGIRRLPCWTG